MTMAEKIKLMADYGCYPLWWASYDKAGDIDPQTLPLNKENEEKRVNISSFIITSPP
ncbi:MAG: hypothetical protein ACKPER_17825 [Dolichospermum sp.]